MIVTLVVEECRLFVAHPPKGKRRGCHGEAHLAQFGGTREPEVWVP